VSWENTSYIEVLRHVRFQPQSCVNSLREPSFQPNPPRPGAGTPWVTSRRYIIPVENDVTSTKFAAYAHPERLVTADWLEQRLGQPGLVVVESDEDVLLYEIGHIPGSVKVDWHTDLNDPVQRDYIDGAAFAELLSDRGISRDDTIVIYGDKNNWWAAYALWVFTLFGHSDVRLLDGGRDKWIGDGRPMTTDATVRPRTQYPVVERNDSVIRAYKEDVLAHLGKPLIDVRSPEEYSGERTTAPAYPEEGALRAGHIPTAKNVPWSQAVAADGTFKPLDDLSSVYRDGAGLTDGDEVVAYCRIGERSSHTWFVLHHLLGFENVRNYDGSWTEWGSAVRVPIAVGTEPGALA
jgi:thiosulfate/3-mercaptopyruvate sulfurtransferase